MYRRTLKPTALAAAIITATSPVQAIDISPGDYTVFPSGTTVGLLYYQHAKADTLRLSDGTDVPGSDLEADIGLARGLYYSEFAGMPALYQGFVAFGGLDANVGGAGASISDGLGDLTLGFSVWPITPDDAQTGTTLGFTTFVTAPTGAHDPDDISLGRGGWSVTPQIGLIQGLGNGWYIDSALDVSIYEDVDAGGNTHAKAEMFQLQAYLRKTIGAKTSLSIGYSGLRGGAETVNGVKTGLKSDVDQLRIFGSHFISDTVQVQGAVFRDFDFDGGFGDQTTFQLRLLKVF